MSGFMDDVQDDLNNLFYSDMNHSATIDGTTVTGFFTEADSARIEQPLASFEGLTADLSAVRRGDEVAVESKLYNVTDIEFLSGRIRLYLDPQ